MKNTTQITKCIVPLLSLGTHSFWCRIRIVLFNPSCSTRMFLDNYFYVLTCGIHRLYRYKHFQVDIIIFITYPSRFQFIQCSNWNKISSELICSGMFSSVLSPLKSTEVKMGAKQFWAFQETHARNVCLSQWLT